MGRPKKKLTDNSVKVRYKTLADGRKSVYLDCCDGGRRTYDFLKLYLLPETDRETVRRNKATMKKVEELQRERTLQLLGIGNGGTGDKPVFHADMPLSEWMDAYIGEQKRYGVKNTAIITKVARILGTIAPDVRMSQVDKDFCLMFIDYLRNDYRARSGQPINRMTAWGYQCKLRAALNSAVRAGVLKKNPMTQIDAADKISMPETRREYLTIDEVKRLIATPCYRERVKQAYLFCCFSGLRYGDMEKLRWRDLSCAGGQWYASIVISKTSEPLLLPLSGKAMEWLPEQEDADPEDIVFSDLPDHSDVCNHLKNWVWSAGIHKDICFHTRRHSFATLTLAATNDIATVSRLLGHTSVATTQIYAEVLMEDKIAAVNKLNGIF
ncbi:site-specific integrase [Parabacteroides distasonis]|uniref:site-specific integrase n=1 Tax=Parabacteroides distasonis TaxID=823 RepID=UPI0018A94DBA|nr:site-specific integrase [Parabacteroides distasonis]